MASRDHCLDHQQLSDLKSGLGLRAAFRSRAASRARSRGPARHASSSSNTHAKSLNILSAR
eukprot:125073-Rhodomonas_salina.1